MTLAAIIPAANAVAANAALASFGAVPHFAVSGLTSAGLTHVGMHDWGTRAAYVAAVKALPGVVWDEGTGDPATRLRALFAGVSAQWPMEAPPLPASGPTVAGRIYSYGAGELWLSINGINRTTFPLPPATYPSELRQRRWPGDVLPWKQPIDGFDSYHAVDVITGQPDRVTHSGKTWDCLIANNVSQPGIANWREVVTSGFPAWLQPTGAGDAYPVGFRVTHAGQNWQNTSPANTFAPGVFGWVVI